MGKCNMKFIITENQNNEILNRASDLIFSVFKSEYPEFSDQYSESKDETEICDNEDCDTLIFYYLWDDKEFYFSSYFAEKLYEMTGLEFFDLDFTRESNIENRKKFDEIVKVFAKRHFGFDVKKVWLHSYS